MKLGLLTALLGTLVLGGSDDPTEVGFDVLAGFDYEEGMELPDEVTKLDETKVTVRGFMKREDGGDGATSTFMLISDACGCEGTPMLNEFIYCESEEEHEIDPSVVTVTGTLYVGEEIEDEVVIGIYALEVESVGS